MTFRMLIDAAHHEETRVVVEENQQISEFDFESETKRPLRGNIYLAKVTRVEPSLQAAFVDYGGNRHGFLAFGEIHPDYYQIPVADREELLRAHAAEQEEVAQLSDPEDEASEDEGQQIENVGGDAHEEIEKRNLTSGRRYKIQEVIKRRQIILVQVVKEERGNKGAALTTYLSLAGRYCVLMPNTARGGGISRKISNSSDRKKLKKTAEKLDVPNGMGLIIRTAGAQRTATEIKRDYKYLMKTWENVRALTLKSSAPALVYEEGSLIRRCIRDLYNKDYDEVLVDGSDAYAEARDYMKLLMPSHARKVKLHKGKQSLFREFGIEDQLAAMFNPMVPLPSGGYLIINQTEALVAVDVNSGRSTGEYSIEKTALNTNLEAAEEVARQMRLRDLAGLIVIDFIDMDEHRNNRSVEKRLKEALKSDRARIQVGRISPFGLLEMSRQRTRSGVLDSSSNTCKHCQGSGMVRSVESRALHVLRHIGEQAAQALEGEITLGLPQDVALYLLNQKRAALRDLESQHAISLSIEIDNDLMAMEMSLTSAADGSEKTVRMDAVAELKPAMRNGKNKRNRKQKRENEDAEQLTNSSSDREADKGSVSPAEDGRGRRRRRGRRGGRNRRAEQVETTEHENVNQDQTEQAEVSVFSISTDETHEDTEPVISTERTPADEVLSPDLTSSEELAPLPADEEKVEKKSRKKAEKTPRPRRRKKADTAAEDEASSSPAEESQAQDEPQNAINTDEASTATEENKQSGPTRRGWWRKS